MDEDLRDEQWEVIAPSSATTQASRETKGRRQDHPQWDSLGAPLGSSLERPSRTVRQLFHLPPPLAGAWQRQLDTGVARSKADLASQLGVSRAHGTQVLRLLELDPRAREAILPLGDPTERRIVGVHTLRSLTKLPAEEQARRIEEFVAGELRRK